MARTYIANPTWWCLRLIGRLAPGVSRTQAVAQLQPIFQTAAYVGLGTPTEGEKPPILSLHDAKSFPGYDEQYGKPLRILMAMVGLVLLIALTQRGHAADGAECDAAARVLSAAGAGRRARRAVSATADRECASGDGGGALAWGFADWQRDCWADWAQIESSLAPDSTVLLFTLGMLVAGCAAVWPGAAARGPRRRGRHWR